MYGTGSDLVAWVLNEIRATPFIPDDIFFLASQTLKEEPELASDD